MAVLAILFMFVSVSMPMLIAMSMSMLTPIKLKKACGCLDFTLSQCRRGHFPACKASKLHFSLTKKRCMVASVLAAACAHHIRNIFRYVLKPHAIPYLHIGLRAHTMATSMRICLCLCLCRPPGWRSLKKFL